MSSHAVISSGSGGTLAPSHFHLIRLGLPEEGGPSYALVNLTDEGDRILGECCTTDTQSEVFSFPRRPFLVRLRANGTPTIAEDQVSIFRTKIWLFMVADMPAGPLASPVLCVRSVGRVPGGLLARAMSELPCRTTLLWVYSSPWVVAGGLR